MGDFRSFQCRRCAPYPGYGLGERLLTEIVTAFGENSMLASFFSCGDPCGEAVDREIRRNENIATAIQPEFRDRQSRERLSRIRVLKREVINRGAQERADLLMGMFIPECGIAVSETIEHHLFMGGCDRSAPQTLAARAVIATSIDANANARAATLPRQALSTHDGARRRDECSDSGSEPPS